jgi:Pyruvate/2-oxoacid:ferredoxin oxidoreductase delta subunit
MADGLRFDQVDFGDAMVGVCPDNDVVKLEPGKGFAFDCDYGKGCGLCAAECSCGAIDRVPEAI